MNIAEIYKKIFSKENTEIKERIFSAQGGSVLWEKYFRFLPLKLTMPLKKYNLDKKRVLDVGSAWGEFLIHFGPGSKGIEILPEAVKFSGSLGLDVDEYNFEDEWRESAGSFDAVWCSNVLEHVVAPHQLLRHFYEALKDDGLIFVRIPTIPSNWLYLKLNKLLLGFLGYEALQHINAFTRKTAEFAIERAGFKIIESSAFLPILKDACSFVTIVAQKIPFQYPSKRPDIHNPKWLNSD